VLWLDKNSRIFVIALVTLGLSVFFITCVPAVYHPTVIDGVVSDCFPPMFVSIAYIISHVTLPVSVVALVIILVIKAKQK
jgi:hypothetical protein